MSELPFQNMRAALKYFLIYLAGLWGINIVIIGFAVVLNQSDPSEFTASEQFELNTAIWVLHLALLFFVLYASAKKFKFITPNDFRYDLKDVGASLLLGAGLGVLLPLLGNLGYFMEESSLLHVQTVESIRSFASFYEGLDTSQFILITIIATFVFSVMRELFFRGILLKLYIRDFKITRATVQVSLLFILAYTVTQLNQFDFLGLFMFSIILCFATFQAKSLVPAIVATIAYDFPVLMYFQMPAFYADPIAFLVFNIDHIALYFAACVCVYVGILPFLEQRHVNAN